MTPSASDAAGRTTEPKAAPASQREPGSGSTVVRLVPGLRPGARKRNVVVGLAYLLGALTTLGVVQFVVEALF